MCVNDNNDDHQLTMMMVMAVGVGCNKQYNTQKKNLVERQSLEKCTFPSSRWYMSDCTYSLSHLPRGLPHSCKILTRCSSPEQICSILFIFCHRFARQLEGVLVRSISGGCEKGVSLSPPVGARIIYLLYLFEAVAQAAGFFYAAAAAAFMAEFYRPRKGKISGESEERGTVGMVHRGIWLWSRLVRMLC